MSYTKLRLFLFGNRRKFWSFSCAAVFLRRFSGDLLKGPVEIGHIVEAGLGGNIGYAQTAVLEQLFGVADLAAVAVFADGLTGLGLEQAAQILFVVVEGGSKAGHGNVVQQIFLQIALLAICRRQR